MNVPVTIGIPTRNRYESLDNCLLSIAFQTVTPSECVIIDDSEKPINITTISRYEYILRLFDEKGIKWKVLYGQKRGQHFSHQTVQEIAENSLIWRIDDDEVAEPNCLENLLSCMNDSVGAVAPLVLLSNPSPLPHGLINSISDIWTPNIQWYKWSGIKEVDHLYSSYLYRKGIAKFDLTLSPKAFREESIHTYQIKLAGYKLLVNGDAIIYHFQEKKGGIR